MQRYNPSDIEAKWQKIWDESGTYTTDLKSPKPKYIAMSMFNYPSGAGIHIGHAMNYTISDVKARFKRQQGFESYHPVGWDAFGLPAENYAIKSGVSPQESMANIIPGYHKQYKAMGWSNDWQKEIATHLPEYYKWSQWIFSEMFRGDLAYQDSRLQWWCTIDKTVLANEQVIDGKCWRHDGPDDPLVEKREVKQWFFKITDYADELLEAIDELDWSESVKLAQKNWIGKSSGAEIDFIVDCNENYVDLHGFTATPDEDFHPWLATKIKSLGRNITTPKLPNTDNPNVNEQVELVLKECKFDEDTVLIGHSLGSVVALKVVEALKSPIKRLVIVAGFGQPGFLDHERPFEKTFNWEFDFDKIKQNVGEIIILRPENDSAVPQERADYLSEKLDARIVDFKAEENHACGKQEPKILDYSVSQVKAFTTRADTIFSAAFIVLAPEHQLTASLTTDENKKAVDSYVRASEQKSEVERQADKDKTGQFTGSYAINPSNGEHIPVWVSDFVLANYGTGAVFGDIHDERDFEFIKKFNIPARVTVVPEDKEEAEKVKAKEYCYTDEGILIDSGEFSGQKTADARVKIISWLAEKGSAKEVVNYRMNDWSVSRQRYWGAPIPIIHCPKCGAVLVPDKELPVILPELTDYAPTGDGHSALARAKDWLNTTCPKCGNPAERETDTLDTYIDSSWYMYRYFDPFNQEAIFDKDIVKKWEPIDFYNGADHATAHLLYARFIARFFKKLGLVNEAEPFKQFLFNGKVTASDGQMFSKSKGNGVDPLEIIESGYGADALRTYLMFAAPLELWVKWDPQGVPGAYRFLARLWTLVSEYTDAKEGELENEYQDALKRAINPTIKKVTEDIEENRYNTAIAATMGTLNELYKIKAKSLVKHQVWEETLSAQVALVAPFAPHIADELWQQLGHSSTVHRDSWPKWDDKYLTSDTVTVVVQINGKLRSELQLAPGTTEEEATNAAKADDKVKKYLDNKEIKKVIYVKDKLINLVIG